MIVLTKRNLRDKTGKFVSNPDAKVKFNCLVCLKEFERYKCEARKAVRHYCSEECQKKDQYQRRGKTHHNYTSLTRNCEYCNQEFLTTPSRIKKGNRFCSYICSSNSRSRKTDNKDTYTYNHRIARQTVDILKHIDKCEICGIKPIIKVHNDKDELLVHHKDGNQKNNLIDNLQVICRRCHSRYHINKKLNKII